MTVSTELSEIAQSGIQEIVEQHRAGQARTNRHISRSTFYFVAVMLLSLAANVFVQQRIERRIGEVQPAAVNLLLVTTTPNPTVCPGDTIRYLLTIDIDEPAVVDNDSVVRNLDTRRTEILSNTVRNIYDQVGVSPVQTSWTLPDVLPATNTRPERLWSAGQYRRIIALTGVEGDKKASVVSVDFRVGTECPNVAR